jgi:hypothetical protein
MNAIRTLAAFALACSLTLLAACTTSQVPTTDGIEELAALADGNGDLDANVQLKITGTVAGSGLRMQAAAPQQLVEVEATTPKGLIVRGVLDGWEGPVLFVAPKLRGRVISVRGVATFIGIVQDGDKTATVVLVAAGKTLPKVSSASTSLRPLAGITLQDLIVSSYVRRPANWNGSSDYIQFKPGNGTPFVAGAGNVSPAGQLPAGKTFEGTLGGSVEVFNTSIGQVARGSLSFTYQKIEWTLSAVLIGL